MKKMSLFLILAGLLAACGGTATPAPPPAPTVGQPTAITLQGGYRPIQPGDSVEGAPIGYHYVFPSLDQPVVVIAASPYLLHFVSVKPELAGGLVSYIKELAKFQTVYAFDENDPSQTDPKLMSWDASKPVEVVFIPIQEGKHKWSVTDGDDTVEDAYKIVRRKDGGLRFVDAYGKNALFSAGGMFTINGSGVGLMLSSRLALLKMILSDPKYQRGANVMAINPPSLDQYDPRIVKLDPSKEGLGKNRDWLLVSRPGPNPGLQGP